MNRYKVEALAFSDRDKSGSHETRYVTADSPDEAKKKAAVEVLEHGFHFVRMEIQKVSIVMKGRFYDPGVRIEEVPLFTFDRYGRVIKVWKENLRKTLIEIGFVSSLIKMWGNYKMRRKWKGYYKVIGFPGIQKATERERQAMSPLERAYWDIYFELKREYLIYGRILTSKEREVLGI